MNAKTPSKARLLDKLGLEKEAIEILQVLDEKDPHGKGIKAREIAMYIWGYEKGDGAYKKMPSGRRVRKHTQKLHDKKLIEQGKQSNNPVNWKITNKGKQLLTKIAR